WGKLRSFAYPGRDALYFLCTGTARGADHFQSRPQCLSRFSLRRYPFYSLTTRSLLIQKCSRFSNRVLSADDYRVEKGVSTTGDNYFQRRGQTSQDTGTVAESFFLNTCANNGTLHQCNRGQTDRSFYQRWTGRDHFAICLFASSRSYPLH